MEAPLMTRCYRNGEECEYTGQSKTLDGARFYEIRIVADSHRIGTILVTQREPRNTTAPANANDPPSAA